MNDEDRVSIREGWLHHYDARTKLSCVAFYERSGNEVAFRLIGANTTDRIYLPEGGADALMTKLDLYFGLFDKTKTPPWEPK